MSAETLRRAAALMRERAEAATEGVWTHAGFGEVVAGYSEPDADDPHSSYYSDSDVATASEMEGDDIQSDNAEHIASWHPAVALAVADWLDRDAEGWELLQNMGLPSDDSFATALAVARAYLGSDA